MSPTLVIGIGGTGIAVAERIYHEKLELVRRQLLTVISLDTDEHSQGRSTLPNRQKILLGSHRPVVSLLNQNEGVEGDWFYRRDDVRPELLKMSLSDGSGTVRMFARLALHDALRRGSLASTLVQSISQLAGVTNSDIRHRAFPRQLNILIVGSLAGGTGSGLFIQLALVLRELVARSFPQNVNLRGLFLLPDVYVRGLGLRPGVWDVNGAAALRELNAMTNAGEQANTADAASFEFMPGVTLRRGQAPYDGITLVDFERADGTTLGHSIRRYEDLLARIADIQLRLPPSTEISSKSVNNPAAGRFGGSVGYPYDSYGVCSIVYPEGAIRDYFTKRLAVNELEDHWLALDQVYKSQVRRFEEIRKAGNFSATPPERDTSYIETIRIYALEGRPFFKQIYQALTEDPSKEQTDYKSSKLQVFLDKFEANIIAELWKFDDDTRHAHEWAYLGLPSYLENRSDLSWNVRDFEHRFYEIWDVLEIAARDAPEIVYARYRSNTRSFSAQASKEHHLQYIANAAPNAVALRYFLYELRGKIEARLKTIDPEEHYRSATNRSRMLDEQLDESNDRQVSQRFIDLARHIQRENLFSRVFSSRLPRFVHDYKRTYTNSLESMCRHIEAITLKHCLERLNADVNFLICRLEAQFDELERLREDLHRALAKDHDSDAEIPPESAEILYVYAGADAREEMWRGVRKVLQDHGSCPEQHISVIESLFEEMTEQHTISTQASERGRSRLRKWFEAEVVDGYCKRKLGEVAGHYSFNVAKAIKKQAALENRQFREFLREIVGYSSQLARPFILLTNPNEAAELLYWTLHPAAKEEIGEDDIFDENQRPGTKIALDVEDDNDPCAIHCVKVLLGFPLTALSKLRPRLRNDQIIFGDSVGSYEASYRLRIENLRQHDLSGTGGGHSWMSPHVDRRWHQAGALPEIFSELDLRRTSDVEGTRSGDAEIVAVNSEPGWQVENDEQYKDVTSALRQESKLLLAEFDQAALDGDAHQRGYLLEDLLGRAFSLHGIEVVQSFRRNHGAEQIDAAFVMNGWHYLVECRWRSKLANIRDLDGLVGQVNRSGRQTMGLFLAINGWSENVIPLLKQNLDKGIFLMTGDDLRRVLDMKIGLRNLLEAKLRALNLEANPFMPASQISA